MQDDPIEILKRRLASGEISVHEFNELSAVLMNRHDQIRDVNHRKHSSSFKGMLVQNDAYMMELSCYIHRNPLRAKVVNRLVRYPWGSYRAYAYRRQIPEWRSTELILSQFTGKDKHKAYREKVQGYAREEKRLLEDVEYGMFLGTEEFIDKIRCTYLPDRAHQEIPQQRKVARAIDPVQLIDTAARLFDGDLDRFRQTARISKSEKANRDLLVLFMWNTGLMTNEEIGALFGLTYSSVSHIVNLIKSRLPHEPKLQKEFDWINSQFKM